MVNSQIEKKGSNINFKKKYDNLDKYLNERKEFADLLFCQHYYDNLIFEGRARKNETKVLEKKNTDINKIFP